MSVSSKVGMQFTIIVINSMVSIYNTVNLNIFVEGGYVPQYPYDNSLLHNLLLFSSPPASDKIPV